MPDPQDTQRGPDGQIWYVVATAHGDIMAAIIVGRLQTAGIPAFIRRESLSTAIPLNVGVLGTFDVLVPEAYYEDALALLEEEEDEGRLLDDGALPLDDPDTIEPS